MAYRPKRKAVHYDFVSLSRPDTTKALTECVQQYWIEKRFSCHAEIGLMKRGSLRADVFALNTKGETVICEIKSSWPDFSTDKKWHKYSRYADKFFFAVSEHMYEKYGERLYEAVKESGAGVLIIMSYGKVYVKHRAKKNEVRKSISRRMLTRCAWRGGRWKI